MTDKSKKILPALYSVPLVERLDLPNRAELLPKIESGELEYLEFRAKVFALGPNANYFLFRDEDMPAFAATFEGQPYLRDHNWDEIEARDGTILASVMQGPEMIQDIRLTTRQGMTDYLEGRMDRFSIGFGHQDIICTICNSSWLSPSCPHWPGRKYQTANGEQTCMLLFTGPRGLETSAVNVPAVDGTGIIIALDAKHELVSGALQAVFSEKPTEPTDPAGQAPELDESQDGDGTQARLNSLARRLALAEISLIPQGDSIMNVRELLKKRSDSLATARGLHAAADAENRDLTAEERTQFEGLMTEVEGLASQIQTIQAERDRLTAAEGTALETGSTDPEKPVSSANPKLMKRNEFDKLAQNDRAAFITGGGKIED